MTFLEIPDASNAVQESSIYEGLMLRAAGSLFTVCAGATAQSVRVEDATTGEVRQCTLAFLEAAIEQGTVVRVEPGHSKSRSTSAIRQLDEMDRLIADIPTALRSNAAVTVMVQKYRWVKRVTQSGVRNLRPAPDLQMVIRDIEHKHGEECPFEMDTLYRAWLEIRRHGTARVLLPKYYLRGGPGGHRLDPTVERFIASALEGLAKPTSGKLRPYRVLNAVSALVLEENRARASTTRLLLSSSSLTDAESATAPASEEASQPQLQTPSLPTITRRFKERFTAYEVAVRNHGKKRADRMFREAGARIRADRPLDIVQYDDTDTCVFMVDDRTTLPWGRCWLTAGVDENTSYPMGMSMCEAARSRSSALDAIVHGIFPKDPKHPDFRDCTGRWEGHGHHGIALLDNAAYNHAMELEASVLEFGTEVEYARPHHPTDKSDIEHFNARLKTEFVMNQPGWSGPKEDREMLDQGIGSAVMTVDEFRRKLVRWLVDDYMNKPMSDGQSPRQKWLNAFELHPPLTPLRHPSMELVGTLPITLTFRDSGGLLRLGLRYQSDELALLRRRMGASAEVAARYSRTTLEYLYVMNPYTKNYLRVPCIEDARYVRGISNFQQRLILKRCRELKKKNPSIIDMQKAREAISLDTKKLSTSKSMHERKRAIRQRKAGFDDGDSELPASTAKNAKVETFVASELELMTMAIDAVDIDSDPDARVFLGGVES